jgi:hypothetical protein
MTFQIGGKSDQIIIGHQVLAGKNQPARQI